ncbi:MAG: pentapeptide repeat-containing protein, partial [Candidatus Omnitrophica bacterium]|nr:pentapeptide repeat-containing protein [Candidatus Omnitrophota bacterium]
MKMVKCKYDGCKERAVALADFCWDHLPEKSSYAELLIKASESKRDLTGANLKKVCVKDAHFEKADLSKANLSQSDFSGTHFFDCNLAGSDMVGANLSNCDLTHCDLTKSDMTKAFLANARLWSSDLTDANLTESDLSGADMWSAKLYNVKFWHTVIVGAKSITRMSFSPGLKAFNNDMINETGALSAEESYRDIKQYFLSNGMYNDASWASFKEKTMERLALKKKGDWNYLPSLLMGALCGYGEKPYRIVLSAFLTILTFSILFFSFNTVERSGDPSYILRWY